jgi:hypothetical protein
MRVDGFASIICTLYVLYLHFAHVKQERSTVMVSMPPDEQLLAKLNEEFPCRELQIRQLAYLFAVGLWALQSFMKFH